MAVQEPTPHYRLREPTLADASERFSSLYGFISSLVDCLQLYSQLMTGYNQLITVYNQLMTIYNQLMTAYIQLIPITNKQIVYTLLIIIF